eukprot:GHVH01017159.1.p1 GENE.GHVH01017159.1~~GHVH01017159.1.p1  ORF type:complete len:588 (-),score=68.52 GHVH01017159.1:1197-2960(-)
MTSADSTKYIPPHLRKQNNDGNLPPAPRQIIGAPTSEPNYPQRMNSREVGGMRRNLRGASSGTFPRSGGGKFEGSGSQKPSQNPDGSWFIPGRPKSRESEFQIFGDANIDKAGGTVYRDVEVYDGVPITLEGLDSDKFKSMDSFAHSKESPSVLHPLVLDNISRLGYTRPSPVQMWSIPVMIANRDLMACAQTGSGKTAGFLCPIISGMLYSGPPAADPSAQLKMSFNGSSEPPSALCMAPTRELATQIYEEARKFTFKTGIRPVVVYGGNPLQNQMREVRRGMDICIGTPGRLLDLVERGCVSLSKIKYFILDEADRMLDMGFAPQIEQIASCTDMSPKDVRQTVMFSATFPRAIQEMARKFMGDYLYLTIGRVGATNECIRQDILYTREVDKPETLMKLLTDVDGLTIVFVDTKRRCDNIANFLTDGNVGCVAIHGDKSQHEREHALGLFRSGAASVMVATDVASRGLDINNVAHVVNVDIPSNIDDYVHRIGRTGRAGNKGIASSMLNEKNSGVVRELIKTLTEAKQEVPKFLVEMISRGGAGRRDGGGRGGGGYSGGPRYGGGGRGGGGGGGGGGDFRRGTRM